MALMLPLAKDETTKRERRKTDLEEIIIVDVADDFLSICDYALSVTNRKSDHTGKRKIVRYGKRFF